MQEQYVIIRNFGGRIWIRIQSQGLLRYEESLGYGDLFIQGGDALAEGIFGELGDAMDV
jgi:hypothetical protein